MFARFMPQEGKFFDLFNTHAEQIVLGSQALLKLLTVLNDSDEDAAKQCDLIDDIENKADGITHETMRQLHKSFITPLDREEIHQLITSLDDILDLIQDAAESMHLFDIQTLPPESDRMATLLEDCCVKVHAAVKLLNSMDNAAAALALSQEIDVLESEADAVMRAGISKLFREEEDVRQLIKHKNVYEYLENAIDKCQDVANIIEAVVVENV